MQNIEPRWSLFRASTNDFGVTHFALSCHPVVVPDSDYDELVSVLKTQFGAIPVGELQGPYSVHKYFQVDDLRIGIILDDPDSLDLYVEDVSRLPAMRALVASILGELNSQLPPNKSLHPTAATSCALAKSSGRRVNFFR